MAELSLHIPQAILNSDKFQVEVRDLADQKVNQNLSFNSSHNISPDLCLGLDLIRILALTLVIISAHTYV